MFDYLSEVLLHIAVLATEVASVKEGWSSLIRSLLTSDRKVAQQRRMYTQEQQLLFTKLQEELTTLDTKDQREKRQKFLHKFNDTYPERSCAVDHLRCSINTP